MSITTAEQYVMSYFTKAEMLKSLRAKAKELGLTFKEQDAYLNGHKLFMIADRETGKVLSSGHTVQSAFDNQETCGFMYDLKK